MKRIKRRNNPEYEYVYFIFRPITTFGGDSDIEVLSGGQLDSEDGETVYRYARDYERMWSELTFETKEDALEALRKFKKSKELEYGHHRKPQYIVNPDIVTDLYLNTTVVDGTEVEEVLGGERVDGEPYSNYLKFVAYIGHQTIKISDD